MTLFSYSLILFGLYVIALFVITYNSGKQEIASDFSIGRRNIGLWQTTASISSGFRDGAGVVVWISLAILFGVNTLWLFGALALGLFALSLTAKKVRAYAEENNIVTLSDLLNKGIGPKTSKISSIIILMTSLLYASAQLSIAGVILSVLFGVTIPIGILITSLIVATYLFIGGYKTVIQTDMFQWLIMVVVVIIPFLISTGDLSSLPILGTIEVDYKMILGICGISFLLTYSYADVWQRIFSAKSPEVARNSLLLTIPVYLIISLGLVIAGLTIGSIVGYTNTNPLLALFEVTTVNPAVLSILGIFILTSVMSTLDTQSFVFAQTVSKNLFKNNDDEAVNKRTRLVLIVLLIFISLIAMTVNDIVSFLFSAVTLTTVLAPVLFFLVTNRINKDCDGYLSKTLIFSAIIYFLMFFSNLFENIILTLIPAGTTLLLLLPKVFTNR